MPKISIVTAYYNRKDLFHNTLKSISLSMFKDFEFIAVDDGSDDDERIEDLQDEFKFLKVIRVEPEDKWYINPSVPFNQAISAATGDIIMMQNPECYHVGDVLSHLANNLKDKDYFSYSCYSLDQEKSAGLTTLNYDKSIPKQLALAMTDLPDRIIPACGKLGWYNHPTLRPTGFHFAAAMHRCHMTELGGFDERYANGIAYDDNEIFVRIRRYGMKVHIIASPIVLHQWHYTPKRWSEMNSNRPTLERKNLEIFHKFTMKEKGWKVNA